MSELKELGEAIIAEIVGDIEETEEGAMKDEQILGLLDSLVAFFDTDKMIKSLVKKLQKREAEGGLGKNAKWFLCVKRKLGLVTDQ